MNDYGKSGIDRKTRKQYSVKRHSAVLCKRIIK